MEIPRILWVSRHKPLRVQQVFLEEVFGGVELVPFSLRVPDGYVVIHALEEKGCEDVVLVAPDRVYIDLCHKGCSPLKSIGRSTNGGTGYVFSKFVRVEAAALETRPLRGRHICRENVLWLMETPAMEHQLVKLLFLLGNGAAVTFDPEFKKPFWKLAELIEGDGVDTIVTHQPLWWFARAKEAFPDVLLLKERVRSSAGDYVDFFTRAGRPMVTRGFEEITKAVWEVGEP